MSGETPRVRGTACRKYAKSLGPHIIARTAVWSGENGENGDVPSQATPEADTVMSGSLRKKA
jgi:hypothetical protein